MDGTVKARFRELVATSLFKKFVDAPLRRDTNYRLNLASLDRVTDADAYWFVRTVEAGLLTEVNGDFLAPRSAAKERIFWHGPKGENPRSLSVVVEPIIGIGAIGRLHMDHGWPVELLGLQPTTWAFDLAAYSYTSEAPRVVGEVKAKPAEIDSMCKHFEQAFGQVTGPSSSGKENWNRKVAWLQGSDASVVWAIGPGRYERIYRITSEPKFGRLFLTSGSRKNLDYRTHFDSTN